MIDSRKFGHAGLRPVLCEGGPAYIHRMKLLNPFVDYSKSGIVEAYEPHYLESAAEANANLFLLTFSEGMLPEYEKDARVQFCEASGDSSGPALPLRTGTITRGATGAAAGLRGSVARAV